LASCSSTKREPAKISAEPTEVKAGEEKSSPTTTTSDIWFKSDSEHLPDTEMRVHPASYDVWKCNYELFTKPLAEEALSLEIPTPQGLLLFEIENSGTMSEALAAKFPEIRSFKGRSKDGQFIARIDTNEKGLFVELSSTNDKWLLAPLFDGNKTIYGLYHESALPSNERDATFK
jgi:hypothetical protein